MPGCTLSTAQPVATLPLIETSATVLPTLVPFASVTSAVSGVPTNTTEIIPTLAFVPPALHTPRFIVHAVAAGLNHTCVLSRGGRVKCWGDNSFGQLGDGTTTGRNKPAYVSGIFNGVIDIAAGGNETCALLEDGGIKCWGANVSGQLGHEPLGNSPTPVDIAGLSEKAIGIAVGDGHACAILESRSAVCWGSNNFGELGNETNANSSAPVPVSGTGEFIAAIAAGGRHTCALSAGGGVKCWGDNSHGQLGDLSNIDRNEPVQVLGLDSGVRAITAGELHTCALKADGEAYCWGENEHGQIGNNSNTNAFSPQFIEDLGQTVVNISAGGAHTCAADSSGAVWCWGWNYYHQLGNATTIDQSMPTKLNGIPSGMQRLLAGGAHTCAITSDNNIECWGNNEKGQLGQKNSYSELPLPVQGLAGVIAAIPKHEYPDCVLSNYGGILCQNGNQLPEPPLADIVEIAEANNFWCTPNKNGGG